MADEQKPDETIEQSKETIAGLQDDLKRVTEQRDAAQRTADVARQTEASTRAQFADLKERLATAEQLNSEMRGYLKRVQEDDVVREELVPIGDPQGEQQLVPKRKPTPFMAPTPYSDFSNRASDGAMYMDRHNRPKPRHWVTY